MLHFLKLFQSPDEPRRTRHRRVEQKEGTVFTWGPPAKYGGRQGRSFFLINFRTVSGKENVSSQRSSKDPRDRATSPFSMNLAFLTKPNPRGLNLLEQLLDDVLSSLVKPWRSIMRATLELCLLSNGPVML